MGVFGYLKDCIGGHKSTPYSNVMNLTQSTPNKLMKSAELTYNELKEKFEGTSELFEDSTFEATYKSCFGVNRPDQDEDDENYDPEKDAVEWLRPQEIMEKCYKRPGSDAQVFVDGASKFDLVQGNVGDCWLVASVACITTREGLLDRIFPYYAEIGSSDYFGCYCFKLCLDGIWREVVIDDRLPTSGGQLYFTKSNEENEFWSALLEKAFAKVFGSYAALCAGSIEEGLSMLTGGITEKLGLDETVTHKMIDEKSRKMLSCLKRGSLLGCSIPTTGEEKGQEIERDDGLIKGHAYSVTGLYGVTLENSRDPDERQEGVRLIRIRNPWGEREWNGRWSDDSSEWHKLSDPIRERLHVNNDDGEFYMQFEDFASTFSYVSMCHFKFQDNDNAGENEDSNWHFKRIDDSWNLASAGGCQTRNFVYNPQYVITIAEMTDDDECSVIFSLIQKNSRAEDSKLAIGLILYNITGVNHPRNVPFSEEFFDKATPIGKSDFNLRREVLMREQLPPGVYCVIPSAINEKSYANFTLRVFTEHPVKLTFIDFPPKNKFRIDQISLDSFATDSDVELMNDCVDKLNHSEATKIYPQNMYDVLTLLVSDGFLHEREEISLECCRSYVALFTDNRGPPEISKEDFGAFLKLIFYLKKSFTAFAEKQEEETKEPVSIGSLKLQTFLASIGIFLPRKLVAKVASRYLSSYFVHAASNDEPAHLEIDFGSLLAIMLRVLSAIEISRDASGSAETTNESEELQIEIMEYLLSI